MRFRTLIAAPLVLTLAAWWGCNAASTDSPSGGNASGAGGSGGNAATVTSSTSGVGGAGVGGSGTGGAGGGDIELDAGADVDQPIDDAGACTGTSEQAALTPLDMIVLLDKSGSMIGSKWDGVTAALETFINDSNSTGIGVGLVFFPNDQNDDCNFIDYANLDVPIAALPGNASTLVAAIDGQGADGGATPTYGALKGALSAATAYQDANPTHKVIVVLATDGDPTSCDEQSASAIAGLASSARNYNGVETYVIAVQGSTISNLNLIAAAGGTGQAYDVTQDVSQFSAKMAEIRQNALACEVPIPPPPENEELDPAKVNVRYTPGGQGSPITFPHVASKANCGNSPGWYYDDNMAPTKILLCPTACQAVQTDTEANLSVVFGCKTVVK